MNMETRIEYLSASNHSEDNDYSIQVSCRGSCQLGTVVNLKSAADHYGPNRKLVFETSVIVQHQSLSNPESGKILGYYTTQKFTLQFYQVFSRECCRDTVKKLLDMINIPFSLDKKEFQWKGRTWMDHWGISGLQSCSNYDKSLKNSQELVEELAEFFQRFKDSEVLPLRSIEKISVGLTIQSLVFLPKDLYEQWFYSWTWNWKECMDLVSGRPADEMAWKIAAVMTLDNLRIVGEAPSEICSICMEELSSEAEAIQMVCSHMFHKSCILKWLKLKQWCPYCRASVTMIVPAKYAPQIQ